MGVSLWADKGKSTKGPEYHEYTLSLIKEAQQGSEEAEAELVERHTRLIHTVVGKHFRNVAFFGQDDAFQIGVIGLLKAIRNFDVNSGNKFSTYAVPTVYGEIARERRDNNTEVKVSREVKDIAFKIIRKELQKQSVDEIVEILEIEESRRGLVALALDFASTSFRSTESIMFDNGSDGKLTFGEVVAADVLVAGDGDWADNFDVEKSLDCLTDREKAVIIGLFREEQTQTKLAEQLGCSQVEISRLKTRALSKMRTYLEDGIKTNNVTRSGSALAKKKKTDLTGDRETAIKLLKETDMTMRAIREETGVPEGTLSKLAIKHRPPEVRAGNKGRGKRTATASKKVGTVTKSKAKVKPEPKRESKPEKVGASFYTPEKGSAPGEIIIPLNLAHSYEAPFTVATKESASSIEFSFNMSLSGKEVDKKQVLDQLEEVSRMVSHVQSDKVSFSVNVESSKEVTE